MELESDRRYPIGSYRRVPRTFGSVDKVPLVVIASDPPAESAAISYCMSPNELRLPRRYDTSVFAPRNDGSRGSSTSPNRPGFSFVHGQTSLTMPPSRNDDSSDTLPTALSHHIFKVDGWQALCLPILPQ